MAIEKFSQISNNTLLEISNLVLFIYFSPVSHFYTPLTTSENHRLVVGMCGSSHSGGVGM